MNVEYSYYKDNKYIIVADFFRYCGGTGFNNAGTAQSAAYAPTSAGITFYCYDQGYSTNRTIPLDTIRDVSPICEAQASYLNSCIAGWQTGYLGIEWYRYRDTIDFDEFAIDECTKWKIYWSSGARPSGTNYSSNTSMHVYDIFMQEDFPKNKSVQFTGAKPIPFFCDGQEVYYNWGAYDPNGDSLWWELDTAWSSWNATTNTYTSLGYNSQFYTNYGTVNFGGLQPMPGVTIDPLSGQLNFIAARPVGYNVANYAVAVTVHEYDKNTGEYKGSVHRDVQFIVLDSCANLAPKDGGGITNFSGQGALIDSNTIEVCYGQNFEFDLIYYDYDTSGALSGDSILVSCNIGDILPGATWTSSGTNPDTVHISWNAIPTEQRRVNFNVQVQDDFCPVTGFNIYAYTIRITPSTFLGPDTAMCSLDTIRLNANGGDTFTWTVLEGDPIQLGVNFGCYDCPRPWIHPSQTTTYAVESNLSETCGNKDTITVEVFDKFPIDLTPKHGGTVSEVVYCASDGLDTLLSATPGGVYLGSGIVNSNGGVFSPDVVDPGVGKDTLVQIVYNLEGVCANSDTLGIRVKGLPDATIITEGPFCVSGGPVMLEAMTPGGVWQAASGNNPTSSGMFDPTLFAAPDTIRVYYTANDSGCVNTDSANLRIIDLYNSSIDSLPKICAGEAVVIHLNDYEGDPFGHFYGDEVYEDPPNSGQYYFNSANLRAGSYDITYEIEGECGSKSTTPLVINPLPDARIFGADSVYCDNIKDSVLLEPATEGGIWGGSLPQLHDGYFVPHRVGEGLYKITYELYDTVTTCYNKQEVNVRIAPTPVRPKIHAGGPYCQGDVIDRTNGIRGDGLLSNTYKWYEVNPADTSDTVLLGAGNPFPYGEVTLMPTIIYGTQMSEYGCESKKSRAIIEVLPSPVANFKPDTTMGTVPLEVRFTNLSHTGEDSVNTTLYYNWTFGPFGSSEEESPSFIFDEIGRYVVSLVTSNGVCTDSHAVSITIDRLTNFFVPNVFTPNGDNVNDLFRWDIEGIGDFHIRIYNRWGTKVFESTELDGFWDGGKEPDGVYFYVVTGKEETLDAEDVEYRGDLTLIRN
ncbi:MAG: hypothetical protein Kow0075_08210 [Salibacteraceae bacterium]